LTFLPYYSFFLAIAILQFFPKFSTISPGLVLFPLLVVLTITALKDAYEDVKRHQSDRRVNHTTTRILSGGGWVNPNVMARKNKTFVRGLPSIRSKGSRVQAHDESKSHPEDAEPPTDAEYDDDAHEEGHHHSVHIWGHEAGADKTRPHWKKSIWEDVRVGDFIRIKDDDPLPADILICSTSEDENVAFVETKNLDGETNLKSRNAIPALTHLRTATDCANIANHFRIDCDRPSINMYKLDATLVMDKSKGSGDAAPTVVKHPIDMQMILLRGTVLRNTRWVTGLVLFTGEDTRIVMNSGGTRSKQSKVERQMNPQVYVYHACPG
jgi:phospholipid-translocating ATPase